MKKLFTYLIGILMCSSAFGQKNHQGPRKFLLRDEGLSQVSLVNLDDSTRNWMVKVPAGRDLQLVGNGRVLIGTGNGYEELDITSGKKLKEVTTYPGAVMARRLKNGNTLLVGFNWEGKKGAVLLEVADDGSKKKVLNFPEYDYVRLVRETKKGYLVPANKVVFESDANGKIIWKAQLTGPQKTNSWQALPAGKGKIVVSAGYAGNFQIFDKEGKALTTFTGPENVNPNFFSGYQILKNGNYLVTNWQGHGPNYGKSGHQLLEFTPQGELVWSWKQDPAKYSSLQGVLALDGLNPEYLYVEGKKGKLKKVK
ncbi:hypothetical protein [Pedobacter sp. SYSU D00535]|uniref:hypothetical protein n=1 Tax=Pedobacter sp. SYSU D00535 TaxID=2810308 RepID=UPI001A9690FA|nr:hypothetical protein [Pedobacter sp. SYSU D00535]